MTIEEAIAKFQAEGLVAKFEGKSWATITGGSGLEEIEFLGGFATVYKEPGFILRNDEDGWLAILGDFDPESDITIGKRRKTLDEAVDAVCEHIRLYKSINNT